MQFIVYILLTDLASFCTSESDSLGKVIFANVLFRHGDRTPIDPYPTDPYRNESLWPVPFGQLTNTGKHQHLELGRWLRNRYTNLIAATYSLYDIYVLSTDVDRTLMSAEANLAGFYPPKGNQVWDLKNWMPIPVHTIPQDEDSLLAVKKFCDKYNFELQTVLNSQEMKNIDQENSELYLYLSKHSGLSVSSLESLEYLYNTLYIEELYNKTLPLWTKSVYPEKMKSLAAKSFMIPAYNKILQRLKSGPLLKNMIMHMQQKSKHSLIPNRKIWMYSAHDETIANLLMTLNLFEPHCPPYAATLLVELRVNNESEHVVTIFYKNTSKEATLLTLPGCISACPLSQFIRLTQDVVPKNWERECLMDFEKYQYSENTATVIAILTSSILLLIILVTIIIVFLYFHYKKEHDQYYLRLSTDGA